MLIDKEQKIVDRKTISMLNLSHINQFDATWHRCTHNFSLVCVWGGVADPEAIHTLTSKAML